MTLNDLELALYRRLDYNSTADTVTQTRLRDYLNETQREIVAEPGMGMLINGSLTFASVDGTPQYALPHAIERIKRVRETTNDILLTPQTQSWYYANYPDPSASEGTPSIWVDLGYAAVSAQPTAATELFVDSTAAGDTNTAYVEGYRTGGFYRAQSAPMTGTTGVPINARITDWVQITKFYLSAAAVGDVTLQVDIAGTTKYSTIPIGSTYARYRSIALVPTPATAITTYTVDFDWNPSAMANAYDEPLLPPAFHHLLAIGARKKEYEKRDDIVRYKLADVEYHRVLSKLKAFLFNSPDFRPHMGRTGEKVSQLGAYYPAGS